MKCVSNASRGMRLTPAVAILILSGSSAWAQSTSPPPYGDSISLAQCKLVLAAAEVEAGKNQWPVAIAIVDAAGYLVAFHRVDNTQHASVEVAQQKAKSAVIYRRPTKVFEDFLAQPNGARFLNLEGAVPFEGGLPIVLNGKVIGAIGVSGATSAQDGQVAAAGLAALVPAAPAAAPNP